MTPEEGLAYKEENAKLKQQIELMQEKIDYLVKKIYGSSSERSSEDDGQLSLFEEQSSRVFTQPESTGEEIETVKVCKKERHRTQIQKDLPVKEEVIPLDNDHCDHCGDKYIIFKKKVGRKIHFKPAELYIVQTYKEVGKCQKCSANINYFGDRLVSAKLPKTFMPGSLVAGDVVANIIQSKYELALPLERQRRSFKELGLNVSESNMCNWVITGSKCLQPLNDELLVQLKQQSHLHGDETPIQVLREPNKTAESKSFLWEIRSAKQVEHPIVYFHYSPSRSKEVAQQLYQGFVGTLVCDGYASYNYIPDQATNAGCWAHSRRKFVDACHGIKSHRSQANKVLGLINQLFEIERKSKNLSLTELLRVRQNRSKPIVAELWELLGSINYIKNSKLGRAIEYTCHQRPRLEVFLNDPQVAISNNIAERSIKTSVIGRKNWLFSTGVAGAKANALFIGLYETAKFNHLNFRKYLIYLFERLPRLENPTNVDRVRAYLPWANEVQELCHD